MEGADDEDFPQPRLKINQYLSPMVAEKKAEAGTLYNSITEEVYGNRVVIQPIKFFKTRIKWFPRETGGGMDCRSLDGIVGSNYGVCAGCAYRQWGEEPPECTAILNFLSIIREPKTDQPLIVVSFLRTSYAEGRQLGAKLRYAMKDIFFKKYGVVSKGTKNEKGAFFILDTDGGVAAGEEEYKQAATLYEVFMGKMVEVDFREEEENFEAPVDDTVSPGAEPEVSDDEFSFR